MRSNKEETSPYNVLYFFRALLYMLFTTSLSKDEVSEGLDETSCGRGRRLLRISA